MKIWVDADACPGVVKDILFRTADRRQIQVTLVANQHLPMPRSEFVSSVRVPAGLDAADHHIVQEMSAGDLVITADIPLAAAVVEKHGDALDPRGDLHTRDNIGSRLAMRNLMDELRGSGFEGGGPAAFSKNDRQAFANSLDRLLTKRLRQQ